MSVAWRFQGLGTGILWWACVRSSRSAVLLGLMCHLTGWAVNDSIETISISLLQKAIHDIHMFWSTIRCQCLHSYPLVREQFLYTQLSSGKQMVALLKQLVQDIEDICVR
ncbi:hypothetical protein F5Y17DRAFT_27986 [Xylariaceae sp. FL0594]|nr:hypothetical protein F5Y17DRAFT_27986 [Xylariaceae sp. FL0594]